MSFSIRHRWKNWKRIFFSGAREKKFTVEYTYNRVIIFHKLRIALITSLCVSSKQSYVRDVFDDVFDKVLILYWSPSGNNVSRRGFLRRQQLYTVLCAPRKTSDRLLAVPKFELAQTKTIPTPALQKRFIIIFNFHFREV